MHWRLPWCNIVIFQKVTMIATMSVMMMVMMMMMMKMMRAVVSI